MDRGAWQATVLGVTVKTEVTEYTSVPFETGILELL